jgi:small-conductance mechanosensitive channel
LGSGSGEVLEWSFCRFFNFISGTYLHSLSIKSITGLKAGFLRRYFAGMVLRFAILTAVFCILVFLFKINTAGIISGAGAGLMISSIVLVLRANKAGR